MIPSITPQQRSALQGLMAKLAQVEATPGRMAFMQQGAR